MNPSPARGIFLSLKSVRHHKSDWGLSRKFAFGVRNIGRFLVGNKGGRSRGESSMPRSSRALFSPYPEQSQPRSVEPKLSGDEFGLIVEATCPSVTTAPHFPNLYPTSTPYVRGSPT